MPKEKNFPVVLNFVCDEESSLYEDFNAEHACSQLSRMLRSMARAESGTFPVGSLLFNFGPDGAWSASVTPLEEYLNDY